MGEQPPLHEQAITSAKQRAGDYVQREYSETQPDRRAEEYVTDPNTGAILKTARLDAEVPPRLTDNAIQADKITRFPTAGLEPFQIQRAEALERAHAILGQHAMTEDVIRAAYFIESGKLPDG